MANLKAIRAAIASTVTANITGIKIYQRVPDSAILPCLIVRPANSDFLKAFRMGLVTHEFELDVLVPSLDSDVAQDQLDDYVGLTGANSIPLVIYNNKTLGLASTQAVMSGMSNYAFTYNFGDVANIGATLRLSVHTDGTA